MGERSTAAAISGGIGVGAAALALLGPGLIHLGLIPPLTGFYCFALGGVLGALLALGFGIAGLLRTREGSGRSGRERAWMGFGIGVALLLVVAIGASSGGAAPPIHDITTSIEDPPTYSDAVRNAPDRVNGVDYPDGGPSVSAQQRAAFPDLTSISLRTTPAKALERSRRTAEALGWTVTWTDFDAMRMEAYETTSVFRFVDDVAIRVRREGSSAVIDLRSNSRVGQGDLGANSARIIAFRDLLLSEE